MSKTKEVKTPASKEDVLSPATETVDAAENHGNVISAQPVVDAGNCKPGHWEGDGQVVKHIEHE